MEILPKRDAKLPNNRKYRLIVSVACREAIQDNQPPAVVEIPNTGLTSRRWTSCRFLHYMLTYIRCVLADKELQPVELHCQWRHQTGTLLPEVHHQRCIVWQSKTSENGADTSLYLSQSSGSVTPVPVPLPLSTGQTLNAAKKKIP